jgi:aspartate racemase
MPPWKTVGVIGGMGPEATVDLMQRVIRATPAADDSDHVRMIVDNNPRVPSRIRALIEGTGESPVPCLQDMARRLEDYGADVLAIPCNTAHVYYDEIASSVGIPVLHMIRLTVARILRDMPGLCAAGLLASDAVIKTGLYVDPLAEKGMGLVHPSPERQADLMAAIRGIKAGGPGARERNALRAAGEDLVESGAEVLIVACTELSLITEALAGVGRHCDAAQVLAEEIVAIGTPS